LRHVTLTLLALAILVAVLPSTATAWDVLDRFRGDTLYAVYDITYRVELRGAQGSGTAVSTYSLHILIEKLNRTHYSVSLLAGNVTYAFTSNDLVFLHAFAPLYLANLSRYFIDMLYIPPVEGVTLDVVLRKEAVTSFLNSVSRWYKIVENTTGEVCQEIKIGNTTVAKAVRYRMVTPKAELVYDCPTGLLVSLKAEIEGSTPEMSATTTISVELSRLNFLNLTSIRPQQPAGSAESQLPLTALIAVAATATAAVLALVFFSRIRKLVSTKPAS
jgi:hypothetical protein